MESYSYVSFFLHSLRMLLNESEFHTLCVVPGRSILLFSCRSRLRVLALIAVLLLSTETKINLGRLVYYTRKVKGGHWHSHG